MAIKIVVLDSESLPAGVEFPPLRLQKYGWEQYPRLIGDEIAERCGRADIVVTLGTDVDRAALEKMNRIGLLICVGEACSRLDQAALTERGVEVLVFPDAELGTPAGAQDLCNRVSAAIDHYLHSAGQ
jgi:phosphoglycerate dehydrogenase-like enzyme